MKNLKFKIIAVVLLLTVLWFQPFSYNDATERKVIQPIWGEMDVQFKSGLFWKGFGSITRTYPNNTTLQAGPESKRSEDTDYWTTSNTGTFSEGDQVLMGHTVKWDLPSTKSQMLLLDKTYGNIDNLATTTLMNFQRETASYSAQRLSSEAHYSGGQSQLKSYFKDQLEKGQVLLITKTKARTLDDGSSKTYIEVEEQIDSNGNYLRSNNEAIYVLGLSSSSVTIDYIKYDPTIYEKLQKKIEFAADEANSKQELVASQQAKQTAIVKGETLIAETRAVEEASEIKEVIQARKAKLVAKEKLEEDKYKAASTLALKRAEAEGDKLKVQAGLSPLEQAEWDYKTQVGVAEALAKRPVPTFVSGGSGNQSNLSNAYAMQEMLVLQKQMSKN